MTMEPDERDAVIAALQAALESFGKSMNELKKERDEARKEAEYCRERYEQLKDEREAEKLSDTPETDAAVLESEGQWSFVLKETCQRLERERDELREEIDRYREKLDLSPLHWKV